MQIVVYYVFLNTEWNFKNIYQEHLALHSFRPFVIFFFFFNELKILQDVAGALRDKDILLLNLHLYVTENENLIKRLLR